MKYIGFIFLGLLLGFGIVIGSYRYRSTQYKQYIITTTDTIINKLQSTSRLTSSTMTVTKIIESQKDISNNVFGFELLNQIEKVLFDDKMIMTVEGIVNAGIDLSKITTENIHISQDNNKTLIKIKLPETEIFDIYLTEKTKPFERSLGILAKGDVNLETQMRNQAVELIRREALSGEILHQAKINAEKTITQLLHTLNENYIIEYTQ